MNRPAFPMPQCLAGLLTLPLGTLPAAWSSPPALAVLNPPGASLVAAPWIVRGGGGGLRGGGAPRANTGFQGSGSSFSRGDRRPQGGFSEGNRTGRVGPPSLDRPSRPVRSVGGSDRPLASRDRSGSPGFGGRNLSTRSVTINRDWRRQTNIGSVNLNPGWARPGWGVARPWNWGWYGIGSNPPWGWWGARAAAWGIGTLATAAIINDAVNNAVQANQTYILVPNTPYQLFYGTVQPSGSSTVNFVVNVGGSDYQITADCRQGWINGREPDSPEEAELLNAACQVAFGEAG